MTTLFSPARLAQQMIFLNAIVRMCFGDCPQNYTKLLDECIHISPTIKSYCEGQAYCHKLNGEILFGDTFMKFSGKSLAEMPVRTWVGLTDLKTERNISREGWKWTDGSTSPSSKNAGWNWSRPKIGERDCTYYYKGSGVYETHCSNTLYPVCQPRSATPPLAKFEMEPIPTDFYGIFFAHSPCTLPMVSAKSIIHCVALCNAQSKGWCVAVYFHEIKKQCLGVLFTDASVKLTPNDGTGWKKFVRRS